MFLLLLGQLTQITAHNQILNDENERQQKEMEREKEEKNALLEKTETLVGELRELREEKDDLVRRLTETTDGAMSLEELDAENKKLKVHWLFVY